MDRPRMAALFLAALFLVVLRPGGVAFAQVDEAGDNPETVRITGDRLSGFVIPVEPIRGDIHFESLRAWRWSVDDTRRLVLDGDVIVNIGAFRFEADAAVVWLNRIPSADGVINQVAVFFRNLKNPAAQSGIGATGERLLITGSARGEVTLDVARLLPGRPANKTLIRDGESRLASHIRAALSGRVDLARQPILDRLPEGRQPFRPVPGGDLPEDIDDGPEFIELPGTGEDRLPPMIDIDGQVRFSGGKVELRTGEDENIITCTGGLTLYYEAADPTKEFSRLTLTAQRAVIFTDPRRIDELARQEIGAGAVRGVYLEGNVQAVADDGRYVVRTPRAFYDFQTGKAIMLNVVMRTFMRSDLPVIYARASEMRQLAANQWSADKAQVSISEFFTPHMSIGADRMVLTQRPSEVRPGTEELFISNDGARMAIDGTSVAWWPHFEGTIERPPLKSVRVSTGKHAGAGLEMQWDVFSLIGSLPPEGMELLLDTDFYAEHGIGLGFDLKYQALGMGVVDVWGIYDTGTDRTSSGQDVDHDGDFRGIALWEHRFDLGHNWTGQGELAYISDESFVTSWRRDDFNKRREYETAAYVKYQQGRDAFTVLAEYEVNEFISNNYLLASRSYQVERQPEFTLREYGRSWMGGDIVYSAETRASRMRMVLEPSTPRELGVPARAFGIGADDPLSDMLRARGLSSSWVSRLDTRHELMFPMVEDGFKVVPFIVGRGTFYDHDFPDFSTDSDDMRLFAAGGVRISTQVQRIYNDVESRTFDLHRLRHIIEPSVTLWYGWTDVDQKDLPVYDEAVESLVDGHAVRLGLLNKLQTQRGGPGHWESVDVLTLRTDVVLTSDGDRRESDTPQFFDYRPEYSQFGDHLYTEGIWQLSDTFAVLGQSTYDLDQSELARASIGAEVRHSPALLMYIEYRFVDASDNQLLAAEWDYQLSPKYRVRVRPQWDFKESEFRSLRVWITRSFPEFDLSLVINHNKIRDDTAIGARIAVRLF